MADDHRYDLIARTIREHGQPNPQFPKDVDIEYSVLKRQLNAVNGLSTVLKNMRENKQVHYGDPFIKDGTVITLVNDYHQETTPLMVPYEEINDAISGNAESKMKKVGGW